MERGLSKNEIIAELTKSPHGKLAEYTPIVQRAVKDDPEFLAHLIAWNREKGQIRDSKSALPILSLSMPGYAPEFTDNSLAHLALLVPRELNKALRFGLEVKTPTYGRALRGLVERYLRAREANRPWWDRTAVQHRAAMKSLYARFHVKPTGFADAILFKGERPPGSVFAVIAGLKDMQPRDAAAAIMERKIPFLIAIGALGAKAKDPDLVMALIERMSAAELVNNTKMLERLGMKMTPAVRAAYEQALARASVSKKVATFKATVAAESMEDETLKAKLAGLQERQIQSQFGIEGNWAVLADKSGSMTKAIETSRHLAATLARVAKGDVHLVFFDTSPRYVNATGKTYDELLQVTKSVTAVGGTSIGCGLLALAEKHIDVDGIAIVSDGGENQPPYFAHVYAAYKQAVGKAVPVYLYLTEGDSNAFGKNMQAAGEDLQTFDLRGGVDYYSLPNLCQTMRVQRYSLIDEIMETNLLALDTVLPAVEKGELTLHA